MSKFTVSVRTVAALVTYQATGTDSAAVLMSAIDQYGICAVTVTPATA